MLALDALVDINRQRLTRLGIDDERQAATPLTGAMGRLYVRDKVAPTSRRQSIFARTSCRMCLSRLRSATSCFSLRFSTSICLTRRSSPTH